AIYYMGLVPSISGSDILHGSNTVVFQVAIYYMGLVPSISGSDILHGSNT
ncbi:hypothetical protein HMPREF9980_08078, partial [Staphylococcus epidermidis NIHLM031]